MNISSIGLNSLFSTHEVNASRSLGNLDDATQRLIENKDKDGNGTLNAVEISISDEAFQRADADGDGELDADELKNSVETIGKELAVRGLPPSLGQEDDDGEDEDSTQTATLQQIFQDADTDGDGTLSVEEFQVAAEQIAEAMGTQKPQGPPPLDSAQGAAQLVQDLDQDGDGALSASEISVSSEVFDAADTNQDGVLSADELAAAAREIGGDLRSQDAGSKHHLFLDLLKSQLEDTTESKLDQVA